MSAGISIGFVDFATFSLGFGAVRRILVVSGAKLGAVTRSDLVTAPQGRWWLLLIVFSFEPHRARVSGTIRLDPLSSG